MTTDLDTRLHRAADSLHRSVENLPLEAAPRPSGRSPVVLGVVLLVVAATTTALVSSSKGGDDGISLPTDTVADVQALVAADLPEGFEVAWAGEQAAGDTDTHVETGIGVDTDDPAVGAVAEGQALGLDTYLYGLADASGTNPFATSDLVVNVWDASGLDAEAATQATAALQSLDGLTGTVATTVRGLEALACAPPSCTVTGTADVTTVWWHETDDLEVVLASRSLSVEQIVAIADGLAIEAEDVTLGALPARLPGPLDEVGRLHDTAVAATRDAVAHWVGYIDTADPTGRYVDVTTLAGDTAELMALVWELGADTQIAVRDTEAWLAVDTTPDTTQIDMVWQEADGVLVHVTSLGVTQDEVLDLVASLQAASAEQWAAVKAEVGDTVDVAAGADTGAGASASAGAQVDPAAGASAGVGADAGTGGDGGTDAGVSVSAGASGAGVDAQANVNVGVAEVEAGLHADLGTEAVIGAVQDTVGQTVATAAQAQAQLEESARQAAEDNPLLP
jgi:hypothetical protein